MIKVPQLCCNDGIVGYFFVWLRQYNYAACYIVNGFVLKKVVAFLWKKYVMMSVLSQTGKNN